MPKTPEKVLEERRRLRAEYGELYDATAKLLFRFDPIGINVGHSTNEYEAEVGTILPRLRSCKSENDVVKIVHEEFIRWFDSSLAGPQERYREIACEIWKLWQEHRSLSLQTELPSELKAIDGAEQLYAWFGFWPTFHDAEVIELHLCRRSSSSLAIHTWEMTSEVDMKGFYVQTKHVVVEFSFNGICELSLSDFNHQNVLAGLDLQKCETGFRLTLNAIYGISGVFETKEISIRLKPGKPSDTRPSA